MLYFCSLIFCPVYFLRKKIVSAITQALKDVRPPGWGLSQEMSERYLHLEAAEEAAAGGPLPRHVRHLRRAHDPADGSCSGGGESARCE